MHLSRSLAGRRGSRALLSSAVAGAVAIGFVGAQPPAPARAAAPQYSLEANVKVTGTTAPYRFRMRSAPTEFPTNLTLYLRRVAASADHPVQEHSWQFQQTTMTCGTALGGCHLKDAGHMGTFGQIHLDFSPTAAATSHADRCPDGSRYGTTTSRRGTLNGVLRLITGTAYFGTVRNGGSGVHVAAAFPATAHKRTFNGHMCTYPATCVASKLLFRSSAPDFVVAQRDVPDPTANLQFLWDTPSGDPMVQVQHRISGDVPRSAFTIVSNQPKPLEHASVDFGTLGPFMSGRLTFIADQDPTDTGNCHGIQRLGTTDGDVVAHLDGFGRYDLPSAPAYMFRSLDH